MSGAAVVGAVTAAVTAGASIYSSRQQSKATKKAADQQAKSSAQQLNQQQQEFNKAHQNEVDVASILGAADNGDDADRRQRRWPRSTRPRWYPFSSRRLIWRRVCASNAPTAGNP
jgi:hypothetical protein